MTAARYHARPGVVIPIGVIVVVAIASVVIAVLGSARRADEVSLATERHLFARALHSYGDRMQREIEAVATSEAAYARIRVNFDIDWIERNVGQRLQSYFDHHFVLSRIRPISFVCHRRKPTRGSGLVQFRPR
jgi:sensor domain CHASE-containing protein